MSPHNDSPEDGVNDISDDERAERGDGEDRRAIHDANMLRYLVDHVHGHDPVRYSSPDDGSPGRNFYRPAPITADPSSGSRQRGYSARGINGTSEGTHSHSRISSVGSYSTRPLAYAAYTDGTRQILSVFGSPVGYPARPSTLPCPYRFLNCEVEFSSVEDWDAHCKSHFRNKLPTTIECPFRCSRAFTELTGEAAWAAKSRHIVADHTSSDPIDASRRPNAALLQHLWTERLIGEAQYRQIRRDGGMIGEYVSVNSQNSVRYAPRDDHRR